MQISSLVFTSKMKQKVRFYFYHFVHSLKVLKNLSKEVVKDINVLIPPEELVRSQFLIGKE